MGTSVRFIGKVLSDGHLSLPENMAKEVGNVFDVRMESLEEPDIYSCAATVAKEKGFSDLTEQEIERIIHESRGVV